MKRIIFTALFLIEMSICFGQDNIPDSIKQLLSAATTDVEKLKVYLQLRRHYADRQSDKMMYFAQQALLLAEKLDDDKARADAMEGIGQAFYKAGNYPQSVEIILKCIELCQSIKYATRIGYCYAILGHTYRNQQDYQQSSGYYHTAAAIGTQLNDDSLRLIAISELAYLKSMAKETDSALYFNDLAFPLSKKVANFYLDGILDTYGVIFEQQGKDEMAKSAYMQAIQIAIAVNDLQGATWFCNHLAGLYKRKVEPDSSIYWAKKAISYASATSYPFNIIESAEILSSVFSSLGDYDSAYTYMLLRNQIKDSLFNLAKNRQSQWLIFNKNLEAEKEMASRKVFMNRIRLYISLGIVLLLLLLSIILFRNIRSRQRTNRLLQERNEKIEDTLKHLRATQAQLIQSEKMASLGQLTAGIAHEIQNPLNFVNNFSEVNRDLIDELDAERLKPNAERNEQLENEILNDIKANEEKILHHGKRADAIVKGMLQHSGSSAGQKEPTDINALCDEYLRLAYHGLRAKDKSFNVKTETYFDTSIGELNVVRQDIGRVILNLINNAFYAVNEKQKQNPVGYTPTVTVSTKKGKDKVEVKVKDNGNGIPQKVLDKIFQPFFTTKPTGQGTGLGLSLAYDIVKAHGGELKVETKEQEGSEFIIQLPLNAST